jgi:hypothetical protein
MAKSHTPASKSARSQSAATGMTLSRGKAPANARIVKSSIKTGTVSRSAAKSVAKAISRAA